MRLSRRRRQKTHKMYLLIQKFVFNVVKGGRNQALIDRLVVRAVNQEDVLDSIGKRLSETFFDNDGIMSFLVERLQHNADIVVSRSVDRAHE